MKKFSLILLSFFVMCGVALSQTSTLTVNSGTGAITGPVSASTFKSANSVQATLTLGTGVQTALAVNVGSAGAPVLFNGAGGTPSGITLTNGTGLPESGVTNLTSDLAAKAPIASPTFTGTVAGITKSMVGLGSVDNTADTAKPVSTAEQAALDLKAPLSSPTFTGTVDSSGASSFKTVVGAGAAPTANGQIAYDSTANMLKYGQNGSTRTVASLAGVEDITSKHIVEGVITATGTTLGTNITSATASGTDSKGKIAIVVGGTGPTSGTVCRISFGRAWANAPVAVLITSLDAASGTSQASAKGLYAGNITTTTFDLTAGTSGITGNLNLGYIVVGQ